MPKLSKDLDGCYTQRSLKIAHDNINTVWDNQQQDNRQDRVRRIRFGRLCYRTVEELVSRLLPWKPKMGGGKLADRFLHIKICSDKIQEYRTRYTRSENRYTGLECVEGSSNESVLSTIISFQIYIQKNAILEKNFEEIFAALPLAQISSKFFH